MILYSEKLLYYTFLLMFGQILTTTFTQWSNHLMTFNKICAKPCIFQHYIFPILTMV